MSWSIKTTQKILHLTELWYIKLIRTYKIKMYIHLLVVDNQISPQILIIVVIHQVNCLWSLSVFLSSLPIHISCCYDVFFKSTPSYYMSNEWWDFLIAYSTFISSLDFITCFLLVILVLQDDINNISRNHISPAFSDLWVQCCSWLTFIDFDILIAVFIPFFSFKNINNFQWF